MLEQDRKDLERRIAELQRRKAAERAEADRAARGGASGSTNRVRTDSARTIRIKLKAHGETYDLSGVAKVQFRCEKPDKHAVKFNAEIIGKICLGDSNAKAHNSFPVSSAISENL